jgi:hypothetical protein
MKRLGTRLNNCWSTIFYFSTKTSYWKSLFIFHGYLQEDQSRMYEANRSRGQTEQSPTTKWPRHCRPPEPARRATILTSRPAARRGHMALPRPPHKGRMGAHAMMTGTSLDLLTWEDMVIEDRTDGAFNAHHADVTRMLAH